jgi:hypothetical protein
MSELNEAPKGEEGVAAATPNRRRRLMQGGLGVAPLLTLVSRPVLGQVCLSPSGTMSMQTSANAKVNYCSGQTPEWWANSLNFGQWPGSILPEDKTIIAGPNIKTKSATLFSECFTCTALMSALAGQTYLQVLQAGGVPSYFAAALLNVKKGLVPVLTEDSLKMMWYEYATKGFYEPTAGVAWYDDKLITFFVSTNA